VGTLRVWREVGGAKGWRMERVCGVKDTEGVWGARPHTNIEREGERESKERKKLERERKKMSERGGSIGGANIFESEWRVGWNHTQIQRERHRETESDRETERQRRIERQRGERAIREREKESERKRRGARRG